MSMSQDMTWRGHGNPWPFDGLGYALPRLQYSRPQFNSLHDRGADHPNHSSHHPSASPVVIVWKVVTQHPFIYIVPNNSHNWNRTKRLVRSGHESHGHDVSTGLMVKGLPWSRSRHGRDITEVKAYPNLPEDAREASILEIESTKPKGLWCQRWRWPLKLRMRAPLRFYSPP